MSRAELEAAARKLYDACPTVKPTWDQLGEVTRSVWIDKAKEKLNEQETVLQRELPARPGLPEPS